MLLLTDQQLSCGFWTALGSLLSTLFCGVSLLLRFFFLPFLLSPTAACQEFICAHTHTHKDGHTCVQIRPTGEIDAFDTSKTYKHSEEGQITSGVFQRLQIKQEVSLSQLLYLCKEGKEENRAFSWNPTTACCQRLQPRKKTKNISRHPHL